MSRVSRDRHKAFKIVCCFLRYVDLFIKAKPLGNKQLLVHETHAPADDRRRCINRYRD